MSPGKVLLLLSVLWSADGHPDGKFSSCFPFCGQDEEVPSCFPFCDSSPGHPAPPTPAPAPAPRPVPASLDFQKSVKTRSGRHLLLVSLLENLDKPVSTARFEGRIGFNLPSVLQGQAWVPPTRSKSGAAPSCCQLEDVPDSTRSGKPLVIEDLLTECKQAGAVYKERGRRLNLFSDQVKERVNNLAEIMLRRRKFKDLLSVATSVRDYVSQELFREALVQVFIKREDVGFLMPMSQEFLPTNFAAGARQQVAAQAAQGGAAVIDVNRDSPPYATYPSSEPESRLWYLREDPQACSHHNYWHALFGDKTVTLDRRGEFFFYMHRQMLVRYTVERMTNGLAPMVPLDPILWDEPIPLGYDPKLQAEAGMNFQARPDNMVMKDLTIPDSTISLRTLNSWYDAIVAAIRNGKVVAKNGTSIPLRYARGRDEGIPILGDIVESLNPIGDESLYGRGLHNQGHNFIARITDPSGIFGDDVGVMFNPATASRDPVFYRWHQVVDNIFFDEYKTSLGPYAEDELTLPGVRIVESKVTSNGKKNQLFTMIDKFTAELHGSVIAGDTSFTARWNQLNHQPFQYEITVDSEHRVQAKMRIFLIPKDTPNPKRPLVIEMDRFLVTLTKGRNTITRRDVESTAAGNRQRTLLELEKDLSSSTVATPELEQYDGCGWPQNLLLPKGTRHGKQFSLVVMLTKLLPGDAALTADQDLVSASAFVHCGLPGGNRVPDSRPMGFPYDRPVTWQVAGRANMKQTEVKIFHQ